jgi:Zn-dependent protease
MNFGDPVLLAISLGVLVMSAVVHEVAHGWAALKLGDPTAYAEGRLTFNPVPHIDPFMTIILPIVLLISSGGSFVFGGAKPVPVNPYLFKKHDRDYAITAFAGPLSNLILATLAAVLLTVLHRAGMAPALRDDVSWNFTVLFIIIMINVSLACFNLLPIPPLDGFALFKYIMPRSLTGPLEKLERFGFMILIIVMVLGIHRFILRILLSGL